MEMIIYFLLLSFCLFGINGQEELLQNPGFEEPFDGDDWYCASCDLVQDTDAYSGSYSGRATNRQANWHTISQNVPLQSNTNYFFSVYIKLLAMEAGVMWHSAVLQVQLDIEGGEPQYLNVALTPYLRLNQGWEKMAGDFYIGGQAVTSFRAFIQVNSASEYVDYLVDDASLTAFYYNPDWKAEANDKINQIRKNDVTINMNITGEYRPENIEIQVAQTTQSYPFGSAVVHSQIAGDTDYNKLYQQTFYDHYNWAVLENALKWKQMEWDKDEIVYPDESILRLNNRSVPVRGHCVFWGVEERVPDWLETMSPEEVEVEIQRRIDYVVPRYAGQLVHWDVNNEQEHGPWFEETLSDPTYMNTMFTDVRARDPNVILFLNEYEVVAGGYVTQSYVNKAIEVEAATGEVGGIGVQSHLSGVPAIAVLQKRLEVLATADLPIWVTELDIEIEDRTQRADAYDDVVTLYYSYPAIEGILMWGFSDLHHWKPLCALFEGEQFEPNAAGLRWQDMMFQRWRSYETFYPQSSEDIFGFRGFHGNYSIQVLHNGEQIQTQEFQLPTGLDITVSLDIN